MGALPVEYNSDCGMTAEGENSDVIDGDLFVSFISKHSNKMISYAHWALNQDVKFVLTRPFLGKMHLEASMVEEIMDEYGAMNSAQWVDYRRAVASLKCFTAVAYNLLYLKYQVPCYRLISIKEDFGLSIHSVLESLRSVLVNAFKELIRQEESHKLTWTAIDPDFNDRMPRGKLFDDKPRRTIDNPGKTVVHLATSFLNLSDDSCLFDLYKRVPENEYADCFPDILGEARIRRMEYKFHSLQSDYDTYISDSNIEQLDGNLPILRGHVSIIFHLLEISTLLSHYYERHLHHVSFSPIDRKLILHTLVDFSLAFVSRFLSSARNLCREMIKEYAEQGNISVPVPSYRGFHVRPSTLVSKIIVHYGSDVYLKMDDGCVYNAGSPLELFRVNEAINARKRKMVLGKIEKILPEIGSIPIMESSFRETTQKILYILMDDKSIIMYESDLSLEEIGFNSEESFPEYVKRAITHALAMGRIDIRTEMKVEFVGDKRVLYDIRLLAETGYGEDQYGNNIMLPKELSYLRR